MYILCTIMYITYIYTYYVCLYNSWRNVSVFVKSGLIFLTGLLCFCVQYNQPVDVVAFIINK